MSRLIDADELIKRLWEKSKAQHDIPLVEHDFRELIHDAPTVDAVEVVRCKDCKWFSQTTLGMDYACWRGAEQVWGETGEHKGQRVCVRLKDGNDYCSYGERRTDQSSKGVRAW